MLMLNLSAFHLYSFACLFTVYLRLLSTCVLTLVLLLHLHYPDCCSDLGGFEDYPGDFDEF